jgi:NAD(P)-dependent dehydrogenase (short-subunit alcohol dehydrogenase family)
MNLTEGRTALVTGAGSGIGRAIALALASQDTRVIVAGRQRDRLEKVRAETCDTADASSVESRAARLRDEDVSILVNNAGIAGPVAPLTEIQVADWDEVFAVNVRGVFLMCQAFLPPKAAAT